MRPPRPLLPGMACLALTTGLMSLMAVLATPSAQAVPCPAGLPLYPTLCDSPTPSATPATPSPSASSPGTQPSDAPEPDPVAEPLLSPAPEPAGQGQTGPIVPAGEPGLAPVDSSSAEPQPPMLATQSTTHPDISPQVRLGSAEQTSEGWQGGNLPLLALGLLVLLLVSIVPRPPSLTLVPPDRSPSDD